MSKILLIDLAHIWWANWHSSADKPISSAFEETVARVRKLSEGYEHVAVCCDSPPYKRLELLPSYKANRVAQPPAALEQYRRTRDRLAADGYLLWAAPGYEADDIIATACGLSRTVANTLDIVIASADKDLLQLVDDAAGHSVLSTRTGETMRAADVMQKFDVTPGQMRDLLALWGDKSDNVPGVPGVGPKTAAKLLAEFSDIDNLLTRITYVEPPKLREKLFAGANDIRLSRKLVTLATDAPIDWAELFRERKPQRMTEQKDWDEGEYEDAEEEEKSDVEAAEKPAEETNTEPEPERAKVLPLERKEPTQPADTKALALAPVSQDWSLALEPASLGGAHKLAVGLFESRLYGKYGNPEAIWAIIVRGRELGLGALTSLDMFHIVEGRPTMHADLIVGLVLRSGKAKFFQVLETSAERAVYETHRVGSPRLVKLSFSIEDAWRADLVKKLDGGGYQGISKSGRPSNWDKYRPVMLRHRCATQLARAVYPDIVSGLYTPDEMSDGTSSVIDAQFEEVG